MRTITNRAEVEHIFGSDDIYITLRGKEKKISIEELEDLIDAGQRMMHQIKHRKGLNIK